MNLRWKIGAVQARYRETGDWYHPLTKFPGALIDKNGYIKFRTEREFRRCKDLSVKKDVHVQGIGIEGIKGYVRKTINQIKREKFEPRDLEDARKWIETTIVQRQGQGRFRDELLSAYDNHCALTDCDTVDVLEAAHIKPYRGNQTNHVQNGLLLRADLHTLFDRKMIAVAADTMTVLVAAGLKQATYASLEGKSIRIPKRKGDRPSRSALDWHRKDAKLG